MTNDEKIEAYYILKKLEHEVEYLHNTLQYWMERLLNNIDCKDDD